MATLWNKGTNATKTVEDFTTGKDRELDLRLAEYDIKGSKAHIKMLLSIGLLNADEETKLQQGLDEIAEEVRSRKFKLDEEVEDIHSQVELLLTKKLGEAGKKIHSGRSRNDQILVDLKLFFKDECEKTRDEMLELFRTLQSLSEKYKNVILPGYTHFQIAMPSSFGLWFGAYAETIADDMFMLKAAHRIADQNPLGSAAGYGSSFPLDREMTTKLLGFKTLSYNSIAAQLGRGKTEKAVAAAIGQIAGTLNKFAEDCCIYMCPNFGFIKFPDSLTTGSSIMPHKKNPDVWEIIRGNCNIIQSAYSEISMMTTNLPHGYHRDYQLLKEIIFPALEKMHSCLNMTSYMLENISVNENILKDSMYDLMFTVEKVNKLAASGVPFREAYKSIGREVNEGKFCFGCQGIKGEKSDAAITVASLNHTHAGSIGNLCNAKIKQKMDEASEW